MYVHAGEGRGLEASHTFTHACARRAIDTSQTRKITRREWQNRLRMTEGRGAGLELGTGTHLQVQKSSCSDRVVDLHCHRGR